MHAVKKHLEIRLHQIGAGHLLPGGLLLVHEPSLHGHPDKDSTEPLQLQRHGYQWYWARAELQLALPQ